MAVEAFGWYVFVCLPDAVTAVLVYTTQTAALVA